jgi:HlyD family secretion protein
MARSKKNERVIVEALPFQGELVRLLEEPLPKGIRGTIYYCVLLALTALTVAVVFHVDVVVVGGGKLTYDGQPIVLQPFERAMLKSLSVRPGDLVRKGQVLATLDSTFSQADLVALEDRKRALRAQVLRLEAEAYGSEYRTESSGEKANALQSEIYLQRSREYQSRLRAFEETVQEARAGLARIRLDLGLLQEQLDVSSSIESMQENLLNLQTSSRLEFLGAKSARLRAEREFQEARERTTELQHRIETATAQRESFVQEWRRGVLEELNRCRSEEAQIDSSLKKSERINSLVTIIAPEDGMVIELASRSVGSVVRDAEPLVVMVPSSAPLICEVEVSSSEVGEVSVGDSVLVKVDAFPFQRFGGVWGTIRSISHESFPVGASGEMDSLSSKKAISRGGMHRVVVDLSDTRAELMPQDRHLFPGMTARGEVHVGQRRLINYILYPLMRGLKESFREV